MVWLLSPANPATAAGPVDYVRDVKPLLAKHCVACHGPDKQRSGLRLDTAAALLKGGNSGPAAVPHKSGESRLLLAVAGGTDDIAAMPPKDKPPLSKAEIAVLRAWVDAGAPAPANEAVAKAAASASQHWSFQPIRRPAEPVVKNPAWVRNPIDRFVLARLEKEKIAPSPEADRATLLRRVSFDLTGLPPSPEEVDAFLKDDRPDAYERVVDRLLASPHYGERWGRHWLDLARYADSNGYSIDSPRSIWPYRDWVINNLNKDMPFDQFTIEQLAGDLLPGATVEQKVATGFHRNTQINEEGGVDKEQFRVESVVDRVNTTGSVWLGLTVGCCRCHDHKFDPLSQREFYQLFAFFNDQDEPTLTLAPANARAPQPPARGRRGGPGGGNTTMVLQERATPRETHVLLGGDFTRPGVRVTPGTPAVLPPLPEREKVGEQAGESETRPDTPNPPRPQSPTRLDLARWLVAPDNPLTARVTVNRIWGHYFGLGLVETENDFGTQGEKPSHPELLDWLASEFVKQGWSLKALHKLIVTSAAYRQSSASRPDLETTDPRNRLLARQSRQRLEAEVVRDAALSASGLLNPKIGGPSVFPPQPAGVDQFTQVKRKWTPSEGPDRYRRGLYTFFWRAAPHPALTAFDAPDAGTTCTRRNRSNTPLQALTLLNDAGFSEYAYGLAARVLRDGETGAEGQTRRAFRLCLGREPTAPEVQRLADFLTKQQAHYKAHPAEATLLLGEDPRALRASTVGLLGSPLGPGPLLATPALIAEGTLGGGGPAGKQLAERTEPADRKAALVLLARVLLNLDEFITRE
jgi:mono/diheme cytochrome c family protein